MNRLNLSAVSSSLRFPVKRGTIDFLQNIFTDLFLEDALKKIGSYYNTGIAFVIRGCESTESLGVTTISQGLIFFNDVLYLSPAQSLTTPSGGNVIYASINTTQYVGNGVDADPVEFSDGNDYNVHNIITCKFFTGSSGSGNIANYSNFFFIDKWREAGQPTTSADLIITSPDCYFNRYLIKDNILYWNIKLINATIANTPASLQINLPPDIYNIFGREIFNGDVGGPQVIQRFDGNLDSYTPLMCRYAFVGGANKVFIFNISGSTFANGTNNKTIEIYSTLQLK